MVGHFVYTTPFLICIVKNKDNFATIANKEDTLLERLKEDILCNYL